jgi:predicted nucleotidyltransferase
MNLPDIFIQSTLEQLDSLDVIGIGIVGSYARGQELKYSDVDIDIFVNKLPANEFDHYTLRYWDDKLISLKQTLITDERAALADPRRAVWAVPGLRGMNIILDKDGSLTDLRKAAQEFDWSPLQSAADEFAADMVMHCAEEVHKVLNGLARESESTVFYAVWGLLKNLPEAVLVQSGLVMTSETRFFDLSQESVGRDTPWTQAFRKGWGLSVDGSRYQVRAAGALTLYSLTAEMLDELIPEKHRPVVNKTLQLIEEAGYS